jgi:hypothetical protein
MSLGAEILYLPTRNMIVWFYRLIIGLFPQFLSLGSGWPEIPRPVPLLATLDRVTKAHSQFWLSEHVRYNSYR